MLLLSHKVFVCQVIATDNRKLEWCEVGMVSGAIFFISNFVKIGQLIQVSKLRNKYGQHIDLLNLHVLLKKESSPKKVMLQSYWEVYRRLT